jgi:formyltetrahydrofolate synthetase
MYRFEEVVALLNDPHPRLNFNELERWVREAMGDAELAEQIAVAIKKGNNERERTYLIKELMKERLNQCRPEEYHEDHIG